MNSADNVNSGAAPFVPPQRFLANSGMPLIQLLVEIVPNHPANEDSTYDAGIAACSEWDMQERIVAALRDVMNDARMSGFKVRIRE